MSTLNATTLSLVAVIFVLSMIVLRYVPSKIAAAIIIVTAYSAVGLTILSFMSVLGQPLPKSMNFMHKDASRLLDVEFAEGRAIYLWLKGADGVPISLELPWNVETAKKLRRAMQAHPEGLMMSGTGVGLGILTPGANDEIKLWPMPQLPGPPKDRDHR